MDLSKLDLTASANQGAWITLKHPATGEDLSAKIKVVGKDSTKFQQLTEEFRRKTLEDMKSNKNMQQRMESAQEHSDAVLVACTLDWQDVMLEGEVLPFTPSNVEMVYKRFGWIKEQIDTAIADRSNFLMP